MARSPSQVICAAEQRTVQAQHSGVLQCCILAEEGRQLLWKIHSGACGHHAVPQTLVGNAFRQGFYWPTVIADTTEIVRSYEGCQFYTRYTHLLA
jgi:hypothetical protein